MAENEEGGDQVRWTTESFKSTGREKYYIHALGFLLL